jgi:D-glycero-D-manno-heptose 1,7-bisphosphate phosphatase
MFLASPHTAPAPRRPAVFLDRDGTLNRPIIFNGKPYPPATLDEFILLEGVAESCGRLKAAGFVLIVATNQPDVGRGTQAQAVVEAMHAHLRQLVPGIDHIEVCYDAGGRRAANAAPQTGAGNVVRRSPDSRG